jgi:hypothetical protein
MVQRCSKSASGKNKEWYFDRGIRVCDRWKDFINFLEDMGIRPDGYQIDRIDNNGNYEPTNCRWVTPKINSRNNRHNTILTLDGVSKRLCEWAEDKGWDRSIISNRLRYGWSVDRTLSEEPIRKTRSDQR